jgi:predicted GIY-YIG superfamily endonuclease
MVCFRCGHASHYANTCFAKRSVNGRPLASFDDSSSSSDDEDDTSDDDARKYKRKTKRPRIAARRAGVYVLLTTSGRYYVGKSNDIDARIRDHRSGAGAYCLNGEPFQEVTRLLTAGSSGDLESWERNETLQRMRTHGINNVRGWMFTATVLSTEDYHDAFRQICEKFDLCRRCGRSSHFAEGCFARSVDTWAGNMACL